MTIINEITIQDKFNKETENGKNKLPFDVFDKLCRLDPTLRGDNVGKFTNWILSKYYEDADIDTLKKALFTYGDASKRGVLSRYGISTNINSFKTYDELIDIVKMLSSKDDFSLSNSELNNRQKLNGQYEILGSTHDFEVIRPLTYKAERYFGSETSWCTVADENYFNDYIGSFGELPLFIIYPKNGESHLKMQFYFVGEEYANSNNKHYDLPLICIIQTLCSNFVDEETGDIITEKHRDLDNLISLCGKLFGEHLFNIEKYLGQQCDVPSYLFSYSDLEYIELPKNITSISRHAFESATKLKEVVIPSKVNFIGYEAFTLCDELESVTLHSNNVTFGGSTFRSCSKLKRFIGPLSSNDGRCLIEGNSIYAFAPCDVKYYVIPDGITAIKDGAFAGARIKGITLPNSLKHIGLEAFVHCFDLENITIPESVESISDNAFIGCFKLKTVKIPYRFKDKLKGIFGVSLASKINFIFYGENNINESNNKKLLFITEEQLKYLKEMAYPSTFNIEEFMSLPSFAKRVEYCNKRLKFLGQGSSRRVYMIDNEKCLKLARNKKGIGQNEAENDGYLQQLNLCPKIYKSDREGLWIEAQLAKKAKESDFKRLLGYDWNIFCSWIEYTAKLYTKRSLYKGENDALFKSDEFESWVYDNDNVFARVNQYMTDFALESYGDLQRISSWGIVSENGQERLVLVDAGLSDSVGRDYYGFKI